MSHISPDANMVGFLSTREPIEIDGGYRGQINSKTQITVGSSGDIDASMSAPNIVVHGSVKGKVDAPRQLEIRSGAKFEGKLTCQPEMLIISGKVRFGED